jgi:hypothetical protein
MSFGSSTGSNNGSGSRSDRFMRPQAVSLPTGFGASDGGSGAGGGVPLGVSTSPAGSLGRTTSWYWDAMEKEGAGGLASPFGPLPATNNNINSSQLVGSASGANSGSGGHSRYGHVEGVAATKLREVRVRACVVCLGSAPVPLCALRCAMRCAVLCCAVMRCTCW